MTPTTEIIVITFPSHLFLGRTNSTFFPRPGLRDSTMGQISVGRQAPGHWNHGRGSAGSSTTRNEPSPPRAVLDQKSRFKIMVLSRIAATIIFTTSSGIARREQAAFALEPQSASAHPFPCRQCKRFERNRQHLPCWICRHSGKLPRVPRSQFSGWGFVGEDPGGPVVFCWQEDIHGTRSRDLSALSLPLVHAPQKACPVKRSLVDAVLGLPSPRPLSAGALDFPESFQKSSLREPSSARSNLSPLHVRAPAPDPCSHHLTSLNPSPAHLERTRMPTVEEPLRPSVLLERHLYPVCARVRHARCACRSHASSARDCERGLG